MGIFTCTIPTFRKEVEISNAPLCKCGGAFVFHEHTHKRKKTKEGITAVCRQCGASFYDFDTDLLITKINSWQNDTND